MSQKQPPKKRRGQVKRKFNFRVSEAESRMVRRQAKKHGLTVSGYVGMLIREADAEPFAKKEEGEE
jgi:predicted HicB family RNase H-like nuclease